MDNEKQKTATEKSFWSMLSKAGSEEGSEFAIYIPRIQRDYAQGRPDDATKQIRDKFVDDIFDCLKNYDKDNKDSKVLDVNFIYGNIEDKDGRKRFVPIDGQQRLTTLFLLHWYFAVFSGKIDLDSVKKTLLQFQYETCNVTGKFCRNLTEYVRVKFTELPNGKKVSDEIRNYYWFFSDFENDSSIRGMLVMIDTIHEKAMECLKESISLDHVFSLLISDNAPIRFLYLNIDDVGLTDSIYIKMNARGKPLTHFENFKAQLRDYLSEDEEFANKFIDNINGKWSEFFWNENYRRRIKDPMSGKEVPEPTFDSQMMKFFRFCMMMDYIVNVDDEIVKNGQKMLRDSLKDLIEEQDYIFTSRLFKDDFRHVKEIESEKPVLSINTFKKINKLLNVLAKRQEQKKSISFATDKEYNKRYIEETEAFRRLIGVSDERALTNEEQVVLYAEYAFLIKYANDDDTFDKGVELTRWLRLVSNLVKPTLNLQLDILFGMIRSVNKLVENSSSIECDKYMRRLLRKNYRKSEMSVFTETQVVEESIKSILMQIDPMWKQAMIDSENTFMDGQTGALFSFAGLTDEYKKQIGAYERANPDAESLDDDAQILTGIDRKSDYYAAFISYLNKFTMLFDRNGLKKEFEEAAIFRRALLCYGDDNSYMLPQNKACRSFLDNTDRDVGFKRLLRDDNGGKRKFLKELMDNINENKPVFEQLQEIINRKILDSDEKGSWNWKEYFIKMPEILDCINTNDETKKDKQGEWVFETPKRYIRFNDENDILLLTKTQVGSYNRELYSYVLFLKAGQQGLNVNYHKDFSDTSEKYVYYENKHGEQIQVVYKKEDAVYIAKKTNGEEIVRYKELKHMLTYVNDTIYVDETVKK